MNVKRWHAESFMQKRKVGKAFVWNIKEKYTAMIIVWRKQKSLFDYYQKHGLPQQQEDNVPRQPQQLQKGCERPGKMTNRNNVICLLIVVLGLVIVEDEKEPHRKNKQAE